MGTLVKHCDHIKSIVQENKNKSPFSPQITLQSATMKNSNSSLHSPSGMWIPIYNYLHQKFI